MSGRRLPASAVERLLTETQLPNEKPLQCKSVSDGIACEISDPAVRHPLRPVLHQKGRQWIDAQSRRVYLVDWLEWLHGQQGDI